MCIRDSSIRTGVTILILDGNYNEIRKSNHIENSFDKLKYKVFHLLSVKISEIFERKNDLYSNAEIKQSGMYTKS